MRDLVRKCFQYDGLEHPRMSEQQWMALYRDFDRDYREYLPFDEAVDFCKHVYEIVVGLNSGALVAVEVAPNVFAPQQTVCMTVYDRAPESHLIELA